MAVVAALAVAVVALSRFTKVAADAPAAYLSAPGVTAGVSRGNTIGDRHHPMPLTRKAS
jgi:hypothetical protein